MVKKYKFKEGFWVDKSKEKSMDKILKELSTSYVFKVKKEKHKNIPMTVYYISFNDLNFWRMVGLYQAKNKIH